MLTRDDLHPEERHGIPDGELARAHLGAVLRSVLRYIGGTPSGRDRWTYRGGPGGRYLTTPTRRYVFSSCTGMGTPYLLASDGRDAWASAVEALVVAKRIGPPPERTTHST